MNKYCIQFDATHRELIEAEYVDATLEVYAVEKPVVRMISFFRKETVVAQYTLGNILGWKLVDSQEET